MRQKKVKRLRKEAIELIKEQRKRIPLANYTGTFSNLYNNFIRQYRKGV